MIHVYTSGDIEALAARLAELLAADPLDPMQAEWVAVPSDGMRRWLALELARHLGAGQPGRADGIAAHIDFPFPGALRQRVLDAGGSTEIPDPWVVDRLVWTVLATIEGHGNDPELRAFSALAAGASLYGKARRVADLFDRYHVHRPAMVRQWSMGHDVDGSGRPIPGQHAWQAHLWRLVRSMVGQPSPAERMPELLSQLSSGLLDPGLPQRLSVFGLTSLPGGRGFLELSRAVAERRELHLFLLEPAVPSDEVLAAWQRTTSDAGLHLRSDDSASGAIHHPLLRTWGRLQRETSLLLAAERSEDWPSPERIVRSGGAEKADSILHQLQTDIQANRAPQGQFDVDPTDCSLQMHACYGLTRQVEVARDAILHLLADPELGLREDDILVLSPALERTASLIEAVFGPSVALQSNASVGETGQAPGLRYRIADRSVREFNQVLSAMADLIAVIGGRFESSTLLDFMALLPVRTKFRLTDDDVAHINEWVEAANVRWGLDPAHRSRLGVPASVDTNTWQQAMDRLLLGSAIFDADIGLTFGDLSVIGVEGSNVDALGRLVELVRTLADLAQESMHARPMAEWVALLRTATTDLLEMPEELRWQMNALWTLLAEVEDSLPADPSVAAIPLPFSDIRRVFGDRLNAVPGRPDFFRGGVTVSSLTPLRGIPFRVVLLLGMDESAFGSGTVEGDDLAAMAPVLGDPDSRAEVRLSLLEAVLAAQERLIVVRDGHDVRTNQEVKPAVVVQELKDAVLATVRPDRREEYAAGLEIQHPRQSFDERCFIAGELGGTGPWGFAPGDLAGANAVRQRTETSLPFLASPLPAEDIGDIDLNDLQRFFRNPVRWFLERRLGALLPRSDEAIGNRLPVALDSLEKWHLGDRLLTAMLNGASPEEWVRTERRRGTLPNDSLENALVLDLTNHVSKLVAAATDRGFSTGTGGIMPVDVALPDGTRIFGSVQNRFAAPDQGPVRILFSKAKSYHRVAASIDLMALVATEPSTSWRALVVNRVDKGLPDVLDLYPLAGENSLGVTAVEALTVLVDCYRRGSCEPLPLFPSFSRDVYEGAPKPDAWRAFGGRADGDDPTVSLVYGDYDFHSLMHLPARADDPPGRSPRVKRYADYLFSAIDRAVGEVQ